jgi:hypothetical protein
MHLSQRLRFLPAGVSGHVSAGLLLTICLGMFLCWITVEDLIVRPARLQRELVGDSIASPLQLRRYEASGFQDPHYEWHYAVSPKRLRALRRNCRPLPHAADLCLIAEQWDDRWWQGIGLDAEGLWVIGEDS